MTDNLPAKYDFKKNLPATMKEIAKLNKQFEGLRTAFNKELAQGKEVETKKGLLPMIVSAVKNIGSRALVKTQDPLKQIVPTLEKLIEKDNEVVTGLFNSAQKLVDDLTQLRNDLDRADKEGWSYEQYIQYLSDKNNVQLSDEVLGLLRNPTFISKEMQDKSVHMLRETLESTFSIGKRIFQAMGQSAYVGVMKLQDTMAKSNVYQVIVPAAQDVQAASQAVEKDVRLNAIIDEGFFQIIEYSHTRMTRAIQAWDELKEIGITGPKGIARLDASVRTLEAEVQQALTYQPANKQGTQTKAIKYETGLAGNTEKIFGKEPEQEALQAPQTPQTPTETDKPKE